MLTQTQLEYTGDMITGFVGRAGGKASYAEVYTFAKRAGACEGLEEAIVMAIKDDRVYLTREPAGLVFTLVSRRR